MKKPDTMCLKSGFFIVVSDFLMQELQVLHNVLSTYTQTAIIAVR